MEGVVIAGHCDCGGDERAWKRHTVVRVYAQEEGGDQSSLRGVVDAKPLSLYLILTLS